MCLLDKQHSCHKCLSKKSYGEPRWNPKEETFKIKTRKKDCFETKKKKLKLTYTVYLSVTSFLYTYLITVCT